MGPRALKSFTVRVKLPEPLKPLLEIAMNLRWSWDPRSKDLFRWVDQKAWVASRHDPMQLLGVVDRRRWDELAADAPFMDFLDEVYQAFRHYREAPKWFQSRDASPLTSLAYFSPEFGISEALPQYSGGLGVLAGDLMKAAAGLGVPITGMGLMYREGYFRQGLSSDGWQQELYVPQDPHSLAIVPVDDVFVEIDLGGRPLRARIWKAEIGRVPLYLLDSDIEENDSEARGVTDRLYGGDPQVHRLEQEMLLGIGGVQALARMGEFPDAYHINEGHAAFLGLARLGRFMKEDGLSFEEALEATRAGNVFTTHTPVPAGIDHFPRELMERYFGNWANSMDIPFDKIMDLGHWPGEPPGAHFNMAIFSMKLSASVSGVSQLHSRVSRRMFQGLWPGIPEDEVPIDSITNGVHARTWVTPEIESVFSRNILPQWDEAGPDRWQGIFEVGDDELWRVHEGARERLVTFVRRRLRESAVHRGYGEADIGWCEEVFDPHMLTIGWARRFAAYKRATLLFAHLDRLKQLLLDAERPVQLVVAGKAHPADEGGKDMIRRIVQFSEDREVRHRVAFLEDYDIGVARVMYQGCDLWLGTPRRPLEACGTSGMKAALNGALHCSVRDGWWDEMYDQEIGWAIASAEGYADLDKRDEAEAANLFDLLERHIIPLFYDRTDGGVPKLWVARMKRSLAALAPKVSASRMVREYVERHYEPAAERTRTFSTDRFARARGLAAWKERVRDEWRGVVVEAVEGDGDVTSLGEGREVRAVVRLGPLGESDVEVQLLHGNVGPEDELVNPTVETMVLDRVADGKHLYKAQFVALKAGRYGFNVRVVPSHPDLANFAEVGRVTWA